MFGGTKIEISQKCKENSIMENWLHKKKLKSVKNMKSESRKPKVPYCNVGLEFALLLKSESIISGLIQKYVDLQSTKDHINYC